jgi:hypothetical protein
VLRTLKSVLDIDKPHKRRKKESESERTMCDRMQMYNILNSDACLLGEIISGNSLEGVSRSVSSVITIGILDLEKADVTINQCFSTDLLCCLVVRVPGYKSGGPGSISGATRFSEK